MAEEVNLVSKALEWAGGAAAALAGIVWQDQKRKVTDLRKEVTGHVQELKDQDRRQLDMIAKLFDKISENDRVYMTKLEQHAEASANRHMELMTTLHQGLARKADK